MMNAASSPNLAPTAFESGLPTEALAPTDLAEIMRAFTAVTDRLQSAHSSLQSEVARLNRELREKNEQLRRSEQLAALGQMAAGIAHEIRNPLGSIHLYASMLTRDLSDRPDSQAISAKISQAVKHLDAIVGDVLLFARDVRVNPAPVGVGDLFDHALESNAGLLADGGVIVRRFDRAGNDAPAALGDPLALNQALVNVIRNAVEAMNGRGELILDAQRMQHQEGQDDESRIALIVSDNGSGVDPAILDRIFNPFFTTRPTGTGLGLAIAHRIVDAHGGRIAIANNTPGPGATVRIELPAALPLAAASVDAEPGGASVKPAKCDGPCRPRRPRALRRQARSLSQRQET